MRAKIYPVVLHMTLIGFAVALVGLIQQNHSLRAALVGEPGLAIGTTVEAIDAVTPDGLPHPLRWNDPAHDRLLLIFTTSCPACKENQAGWRHLAATVGAEVEVVGISLDDTEATQIYRDAHDLRFPVVVATNRTAFAEAYAVTSVPTTLLVGRDGRVRGVWTGVLSQEHQAAIVASARGQARPFWPRVASILDRVRRPTPSS